MKRLVFVILGVTVFVIATSICDRDVCAKSKVAAQGVTKSAPRIADEPYVGGGSSGDKVLTVEEAEERLEQGKPKGEGCKRKPEPEQEGEGEEKVEDESKRPKVVYYGAGVAGGGFAKNAKLGMNGFCGAYSFVEYRFSKILGVAFDTYGGWLMGNGSFYYSALNIGARIYPMAYSNPKFELFLEAGGHGLEMATNNSLVNGVAIGQGGYGGVGIIIRPEHGLFGFSVHGRTSILWMEGPTDAGGGAKKRMLAVPIIGLISIVL